MITHEAAEVAEAVTVDDSFTVDASVGDAPAMLPRGSPVGLEAVGEAVSAHGKTVTVDVQIARLDWLEADAADWESAMSAGYAELATGCTSTEKSWISSPGASSCSRREAEYEGSRTQKGECGEEKGNQAARAHENPTQSW